MTLKIDKAGRVILPKPVRDRLGLHAGSDLEIQETPEGVVLKPAGRRPSLVKQGSFWVHTGEIPKAMTSSRRLTKIANNGCAKHGARTPGGGEPASTQRPGSRCTRRDGQPEAPGVYQRP